jgi:hypothetical protein
MALYDTAVIADAPYLYWKLNESSGLPQDSSGNARHSTGQKDTVTWGATGPPRNFDGDTALSCTAAGNFYWGPPGNDWLNPPCTLECLASRNPSDSAGAYNGSRIFSSERNDFGGGWGPGFEESSTQFALHSFGQRNDSGYNVTNNRWYHLVWLYDGGTSTWKSYVDGVLVYNAAGFGAGRRSFTPFRVGSFGNSDAAGGPVSSPFYGLVSRVAIYNYALAEARVQRHASLFLQPAPTPTLQIARRRSRATSW